MARLMNLRRIENPFKHLRGSFFEKIVKRLEIWDRDLSRGYELMMSLPPEAEYPMEPFEKIRDLLSKFDVSSFSVAGDI